MKLRTLVLILVCAVIGVGVWLFVSDRGHEEPSVRAKQASTHRLASRKPATVQNLVKVRESRGKKQETKPTHRRRHWNQSGRADDVSPEERKIFDEIDEALHVEDFNAVLGLAEKLGHSTNDVARLRAVEALGWFNENALPELTLFLVDPSEDVRSAAHDEWMAALSQEESEELRAATIEATMGVIKDPELLEDIAFNLNELPLMTALNSVVAVINGENEAAAEAALEAYSFLTGQEYTTFEEAQNWVDNNVEADDESEDTPVYRASRHPEVFDKETDLSGVRIVNDTEYEIPAREEAETGNGSESKEAKE